MHTRITFGISFFVKKYKAKSGLAPIYARITVKGKYLDVSLKRKVELSNWDERSGTTKGRKDEAHKLNQYLRAGSQPLLRVSGRARKRTKARDPGGGQEPLPR